MIHKTIQSNNKKQLQKKTVKNLQNSMWNIRWVGITVSDMQITVDDQVKKILGKSCNRDIATQAQIFNNCIVVTH